MPTINQLSAVDSVASSDQIPIYSSNNGDARKTSVSNLAKFLSTSVTSTDNLITQYFTTSTSGFTVNVNDSNNSVWLVLTPTTTMAAGTIKLPAVANCINKQEILICTTQAITSLTINANGASIIGAPSTLTAGTFFKMRFECVTSTWYRIG